MTSPEKRRMVMNEVERQVEKDDADAMYTPFDFSDRESLVEQAAACIRSIEAIDRR